VRTWSYLAEGLESGHLSLKARSSNWQWGRIMKKVVPFIGLFERGDDKNKLTAEQIYFS